MYLFVDIRIFLENIEPIIGEFLDVSELFSQVSIFRHVYWRIKNFHFRWEIYPSEKEIFKFRRVYFSIHLELAFKVNYGLVLLSFKAAPVAVNRP